MLAPPGELAHPPRGNPGSATVNYPEVKLDDNISSFTAVRSLSSTCGNRRVMGEDVWRPVRVCRYWSKSEDKRHQTVTTAI